MNPLENEIRHTVIDLSGCQNDVGKSRIIAYQEPRINGNAVAANARSRSQNVDTGMLVGNPDNLIHIHIIGAADLRQLIGKCNVDITEGILYYLGHLCGTNIRYHDLSLTERAVQSFYFFTDLRAVCTNRTGIMFQLIYHISRNDTLRCVYQIDVLSNGKAVGFNDRTHVFIDGSRRYRRLDDHRCALRADTHNVLHCLYHVACIHLFTCLIIGSRHCHDIHIRALIFMRKTNSFAHCLLEQFVKTILLKGSFSLIQGIYQLLIIIRSYNLYPMCCKHQRSGKTDITKSYYINHDASPFLFRI